MNIAYIRARTAKQQLSSEMDKEDRDRADWQGGYDAMVDAARQDIPALIARVDELEAALRPFAEAGEISIEFEWQPQHYMLEGFAKLTHGSLHAAALAMKAPAKPEYKQEFDGG